LTSIIPFSSFFNKNTANIFYHDYRCGILHQGEVQNNSIIRSLKTMPLMQYISQNKQMIINRKSFHSSIVNYYQDYLSELSDQTNIELRKIFKTKMDHICRWV